MSMKLTRAIYEDLIIQDIAQLMKHMPDTLERQHIEDVLNGSVECYYGATKEADSSGGLTSFSLADGCGKCQIFVSGRNDMNEHDKLMAALESTFQCNSVENRLAWDKAYREYKAALAAGKGPLVLDAVFHADGLPPICLDTERYVMYKGQCYRLPNRGT